MNNKILSKDEFYHALSHSLPVEVSLGSSITAYFVTINGLIHFNVEINFNQGITLLSTTNVCSTTSEWFQFYESLLD